MIVEGLEEEQSEEVKLMNVLQNEKLFHDDKMNRLRKRLEQAKEENSIIQQKKESVLRDHE